MKLLSMLMLPLILLVTAARAAAMDNPHVIDNAQMFSADAIARADAVIKQVKQEHNQDIVVETFASIPPDLKDRYDASRREQFFNEWKGQRYSALNVDGVYVLICRDPSYFQIGIGEQTSRRAFTTANRDQMRDVMLSGFKQKDFDSGLVKAVEFAKQTFDQNVGSKRAAPPPVAMPGQTGAPPVAQPRNSGGVARPSGGPNFGCFSIALVVIGIFIVLSIVRRMFGARRYGPGYGPGGYGPGGVGPGGYGYPGGGGGGFGTGLLGGLLGGMLGGYAQDRWSHRHDSAQGGFPPPMSGGSSDQGFLSDPGQMHQDTGGGFGGGDFGGGGGGGDFGGGGGGDAGGGGGGGDSSGGAAF